MRKMKRSKKNTAFYRKQRQQKHREFLDALKHPPEEPVDPDELARKIWEQVQKDINDEKAQKQKQKQYEYEKISEVTKWYNTI